MAVKGPEELPIFPHRDKILQHIRTHRVTHIQGETGCGKSTQVPKYIMEDAEKDLKEGRGCGRTKIVVTQPRRMAAITLARRVASELDEDIGKTVGYKISGDTVSGKLCFATTGFLLQVLVNQPEEFGTYTHVILDEVHERSVDADLLTMLMKLLMQCYPEVKLIVMSATLQAKLFAEYFENLESEYLSQARRPRGRQAPKLKVEPIFVGVRTYPVEEIFLDELDHHFEIAGGFARIGIDKALRGFSGMGKGGKGKGGSASGFKRLEPQITEGFDELCRDLVQQMAREQCTLIVFLPGIADITAFYETLAPLDTSRRKADWSNSWRDDEEPATVPSSSGKVSLKIYPMHSLIPREEQEEVFNEPPKGVCHVVLASNIAESSLTLPSVCGIIDLAMRRSIQYDARRLMSCLVTTWCSQSSCKQRAGRAGRTMPGRAVRLVTRGFFEREMVAFDPPEMLNAPLTKLYLQAKQLCAKLDNLWDEGVIPEGLDMDLSTPTLLLGEVVQPPSVTLIHAAITELSAVGCIDSPSEEASITPLGYVAMALPCELRLCRLIYIGLMLQCPCDAIAMVAGLTAADPFSTPSLLVLKDEKEYCKKLERSFAARRWCDRGRFSEPLMLRDIFAEWIQAGAPRGFRAMGGFARDWSIIPKKFDALATEAVDLCMRVSKLLSPRSSGYQAIQRLLATMRFTIDRREDLSRSNFPADAEYKKLFSEDVGLMRALLCASFSDQMLLQLKPRWAPSGGQKKRKEEQMCEIMKKQELNPSGTVCFLNPPQELRHGDADENHQLLCEAMCGERAARIHWDDREKLLFYDFKLRRKAKFPESAEAGFDPCPVIQDVVPQVHRLHQFGAGRYKFTVESPIELESNQWGHEESNAKSTLELFKPLQPFLINWEVVQHNSLSEGGKKGAKKPMSVKAMPDWRNPLGFACNARSDLPAEELIGVCASVQGLEAGGSAFVAGATALGLNYVPLLLATLDPRKWDLQWGFDSQTGEVRAIKIMHFEILLPPDTLTEDVLWKVNAIRGKILESLTPWEEEEEVKPRRKGKGSKGKGKGYNSAGAYIWVENITQEMNDLLEEIWPTPDPVQKPKNKLLYCSAIGEAVSDVLEPLQPLAEEMDYTAIQAGNSAKQEKGKKSKQNKANQAGEDWMHHVSSKQGVSAKDSKAVIDLINYLWKQPSHEGKLSALCGRFPCNKKTIQKYPEYLECSALNSSKTEFMVRAVGANGWSGQNGGQDRASGKAKASRDKERPSAASSRTWTSGGAANSSGKGGSSSLEARIDRLCGTKDMACQGGDFDNRVRSWIRRFEARRGTANMEMAFEVLGEWCSKKERDQVRNWPSYLMVLLRNWERNTFEEEVAD